jgi:hypothetical protein
MKKARLPLGLCATNGKSARPSARTNGTHTTQKRASRLFFFTDSQQLAQQPSQGRTTQSGNIQILCAVLRPHFGTLTHAPALLLA